MKVYTPVHTKYEEATKAEANKKNRTPSLNYQKTGLRLQDSIQFKRSEACLSNCPVCNHKNTMALSNHSEVNAENERRRRQAGGDSFEAISAQVGCYCYQLQSCSGDDCALCESLLEQNPNADLDKHEHRCPCQVTFEEKNRQSIALSIAKNNARESKQPCKCALSCMIIYLIDSITHKYYLDVCFS